VAGKQAAVAVHQPLVFKALQAELDLLLVAVAAAEMETMLIQGVAVVAD
jgi:hypothetical protein